MSDVLMSDESCHQIWGKKTFCLISGASQGIGRQIAIDFAKKVSKNSLFLLMARNVNGLEETKDLMSEVADINVSVHSVDLQTPNEYDFKQLINSVLETFDVKPLDFEVILVVHNAGSLGDITEYVADMKDMEKFQNYFTLNLFSVSILNSDILNIFDLHKIAGHKSNIPPIPPKDCCETPKICIVNITSLCSTAPFSSMGYYCISKAGREMYFQVLAAENPEYIVLNYSPGPVFTEMTNEIITHIRNPNIKNSFLSMIESDTILKPPETVAKLVQILDRGNFKSGCRIDYYDRYDEIEGENLA